MKKIIAGAGGWLASTTAKDWARQHGLDEPAASLVAWIAGAFVTTALLRL